jgi:general secretion pathway protein B
MSFILDALKKSESDRQRQSGPALFEVRVAPPRNSLPLWAVGLGVLLAVNLVIVAWVLLRRPAAQDPSSAGADPGSHLTSQLYAGGQPGNPQGTGPLQPTPAQGTQGANMAGYPGPQPGFTPPGSSTAAGPGGPMGQPAGMTQAAGGAQAGWAPQPPPGAVNQQGAVAGAGAPAGYEQQGANVNGISAANGAGGGPADTGGENPDDYAPAADPPTMPGFANRVTRSTATGVPLYQEAAQTTHLPSLHLDLHVFAANPQQRFVMINTHKLREGDALPEGVRVESITPEGAVLSQNGTRFLLPRE